MNFTLKQLRYVHEVGRLGSISQAASAMNISQSSVTSAIDSIETALGFTIFRRVPSAGLQATSAGIDVLNRTAHFLTNADAFKAELASLASGECGVLKLAIHLASSRYVSHAILKAFASKSADVDIRVVEGDMDYIFGLLDRAEVDFAMPLRRIDCRNYGFVPLFDSRPFAVLPMGHPLAMQASVSLAELAELPMILLDVPLSRERQIEMFQNFDLEPDIRHRVKTASMACIMASNDFGFTILNTRDPGAHEAKIGVACVPIRDSIYSPVYGLAYPERLQLSPVARHFMNAAKDVAEAGGFEEVRLPYEPSIH